MGRLGRGLDITKFSISRIRESPGLLGLPLFAGVLIVLVVSIFFMGLWYIGNVETPSWFGRIFLLLIIIVYYVTFLIRVTFEAAQVAYVHTKIEEGRGSAIRGLGATGGRAWTLAGFAGYQMAVNIFLKFYSVKAVFEGEIGFKRAEDGEMDYYSPGTETATEFYLTLPFILYEKEDLDKSLKQSKEMVMESWGDTITGRLTVGFIFFLLLVPAIFAFFYLLFSEWTEAIVLPMLITVGYMIVLVSLRSVGSSVMQAAMYRYAKTGEMEIEVPSWVKPGPLIEKAPVIPAKPVPIDEPVKLNRIVVVNTPDGREEKGIVSRLESGLATVTFPDGSKLDVDESCCKVVG
jgi:hypothetical protein